MTLSANLGKAADTLIGQFGNTGLVYTYSLAITSENDEGDITVSDWGTSTSIKVVDGDNAKELLVNAPMGRESVGEDEKIIKRTVSIAVNDRITVDSVEYRVYQVNPLRTQDEVIAQVITIKRTTSITNW